MTIELARHALAAAGTPATTVHRLAEGMSSTAWLGIAAGTQFVVRTPRDHGRSRRPGYRIEARLNQALRDAGVPTTTTQVVTVDGIECTVAPRIAGQPVRPEQWSDRFVDQLARALHATHTLPTRGWGPPVDVTTAPRGACADGAAAAVTRFVLATIWPFDGSRLDDHPAASRFPDRLDRIAAREPAIRSEAERGRGLAHTDLHWDHLLRGADGELSGLLDFGDACIAAVAWDFACLRYYHGDAVTRRVAAAYPGGTTVDARGRILGTAFALYKLAKTPERPDVIERVAGLL